MFNREKILEKLEGIIGYSTSSEYGVSDPELTTGTNPIYKIDRKHPLTNHKNLYATYPKDLDYANYEDYLFSMRRESILEAIQKLFQYKQLNARSKSLLTDVAGIFGEKLSADTPTLVGDGFVGYRVLPRELGYRAMKLTRLGLSFMEAQQLTLYVFRGEHFDKLEAYAEVTLDYTQAGRYEWLPIEPIELNFDDEEVNYYIGYFEEDLTGGNQPLSRPYDFSVPACGSCNAQDARRYKSWAPYVSLYPFRADPLTDDVEATNKTTYGLNLSFSISCDVTPILLRNSDQIAELAVQRAVIRHLREIYHSTEINKEGDRLPSQAYLALYGDYTTSGTQPLNKGLEKDYEKLLEATSFELSGLGDKCLGCNKPGILSWR